MYPAEAQAEARQFRIYLAIVTALTLAAVLVTGGILLHVNHELEEVEDGNGCETCFAPCTIDAHCANKLNIYKADGVTNFITGYTCKSQVCVFTSSIVVAPITSCIGCDANVQFCRSFAAGNDHRECLTAAATVSSGNVTCTYIPQGCLAVAA